jgi:hypothetical protein
MSGWRTTGAGDDHGRLLERVEEVLVSIVVRDADVAEERVLAVRRDVVPENVRALGEDGLVRARVAVDVEEEGALVAVGLPLEEYLAVDRGGLADEAVVRVDGVRGVLDPEVQRRHTDPVSSLEPEPIGRRASVGRRYNSAAAGRSVEDAGDEGGFGATEEFVRGGGRAAEGAPDLVVAGFPG